MRYLSQRLKAHSVMFGFALKDENLHAPNEFFRLSSFERGERAWPLLLERLGEHRPDLRRRTATTPGDTRARPWSSRRVNGLSTPTAALEPPHPLLENRLHVTTDLADGEPPPVRADRASVAVAWHDPNR